VTPTNKADAGFSHRFLHTHGGKKPQNYPHDLQKTRKSSDG